MKKIICLMLVMVMMASFFGCASNGSKVKNEEEIKSALVGKWGTQTKDGEKNKNIGWIFNADGTASSFAFGAGAKGTYVIEDGKIALTYESGDTTYFVYSFADGELKLKGEDSSWWNMWKH